MKLALILAVAGALCAIPAMADAATKHHQQRVVVHAMTSADPHVACTEAGCWPVPVGCGKRPGVPGASGPARYDEVVCPSMSPGLRPR